MLTQALSADPEGLVQIALCPESVRQRREYLGSRILFQYFFTLLDAFSQTKGIRHFHTLSDDG
jgi:hypothetical protein